MRELFHLLRCVSLNLVTHPPACLTRRIWPPSPAPFDFGFDICGVRKKRNRSIFRYLHGDLTITRTVAFYKKVF